MRDFIFYFSAVWLLISSLSVALSAYPVRSVLSLISAFLATSLLWLDLGAEFLALVLVFVYVGAVMALFLFIVFMINMDYLKSQVPMMIRVIFISTLGLGFCWLVWKGMHSVVSHELSGSGVGEVVPAPNTQMIGVRLFTQYTLVFEYVGIVLLSAMVAAIALVNRKNTQAKYQDISQQVAREEKDCITWMKS